MNHHINEININEIKIGTRHRKDMGDIEALAQSIQEEGLLQPIGVTPDKELVFGERRLRAYRDVLGRDTIPARIVDVQSVLAGQIAENTMRKDFTPSELVAIVDALRSFSHGGDRRSDQARKCDDETLTVDEAAKLVGLGGKDGYNRAKTVIEKGVSELVEAMDTGKLSISAASKLAGLEPDQQRRVLTHGPDHAMWFVNQIRKQRNGESTPEYSTPQWLFDHLNDEFHFTLDVAALPETAKCARYFTPQDDGLSQSWAGEVVWLNPPFSNREIGAWVKKAYEESRADATVVMLIPSSYKGYRWWREYCTQGEIRFIHEYVTFPRLGEKQTACVDVTVVILGPQFQPLSSGPVISRARIERLAQERVASKVATNPVIPVAAKPEVQVEPLVVPLPPPTLNTILQGDCRDLIPLLTKKSINLCLCSPPYADQRKGQYPGISEMEYPQFTVEWMSKLWDKLTDNGSVLVVIDPHVNKGVMADYVLKTQLAMRDFGWKQHQTLIWHKRDRGPLGHTGWLRHCHEQMLWFSKTSKPFCDPMACGKPCPNVAITEIRYSKSTPGGKAPKPGVARLSDVIDVPVGGNDKGIEHPAMFPVELAETLIQTFCPPGGTVLDNFAGSGTTLVAAKRLGRNYYGIDLVPDFCEIARRRLGEAALAVAG